jgi:hypothetical protein
MGFELFRERMDSAPQFRTLSIATTNEMILLHRAEVVGKPAPSIFIYIDEFRRLAKKWEDTKLAEIGSTVLGKRRQKLISDHIRVNETEFLTLMGGIVSSAALHSVLLSTLDNRALRLEGTVSSVSLIASSHV